MLAVLLVAIAVVLVIGHDADSGGKPLVTGGVQLVAGIVAGFLIGVVASLMGVAGGELLIPTLILLFGADVKLAGSLSLAVACAMRSLPPLQPDSTVACLAESLFRGVISAGSTSAAIAPRCWHLSGACAPCCVSCWFRQ